VKEAYPNIKVIELEVDVRKSDQVKAGIEATVKTFGRLVSVFTYNLHSNI
jgi:hypothetical protein